MISTESTVRVLGLGVTSWLEPSGTESAKDSRILVVLKIYVSTLDLYKSISDDWNKALFAFNYVDLLLWTTVRLSTYIDEYKDFLPSFNVQPSNVDLPVRSVDA